MNRIIAYSCFLFIICICSQSIAQLPYTPESRKNYMIKNASLEDYFELTGDQLIMFASTDAKKNNSVEAAIYADEVDIFQRIIINSNRSLELYSNKEIQRFNRDKFGALPGSQNSFRYREKDSLPLRGLRVALDPGHFAGSFEEAAVESRLAKVITSEKEVYSIYEAEITYITAYILADTLRKLGADVMMTRNKHGHTAFEKPFDQWIKDDLQRTADSLLNLKKITPEYKKLLLATTDPKKLYQLFFQQHELEQRAKIINAFNPDITIIIHYNADAQNGRFDNKGNLIGSKQNFNMIFIPGAYIMSELRKTEDRMHFAKALLTNQFDASLEISEYVMEGFIQLTKIEPHSLEKSLKYIQNATIFTGTRGIYARNLVLTRLVNSPLVYGETLYQDNEDEVKKLTTKDFNFKGQMVSYRTYEVAMAYLYGIVNYTKRSNDLKAR